MILHSLCESEGESVSLASAWSGGGPPVYVGMQTAGLSKLELGSVVGLKRAEFYSKR